jgi:hypothetical protein
VPPRDSVPGVADDVGVFITSLRPTVRAQHRVPRVISGARVSARVGVSVTGLE